jgi:hypothetical protein
MPAHIHLYEEILALPTVFRQQLGDKIDVSPLDPDVKKLLDKIEMLTNV